MFRRGTTALVLAVAAHVAFVLLLLAAPSRLRQLQNTVEMDVWRSTKTPRVHPVEEPPVLVEPPPPRPVVRRSEPVPKTPEEPVAPPEEPALKDPDPAAKEAPAVFDIPDNSFALDRSAEQAMAPSDGNTALAAVAAAGEPSVRGTRPIPQPDTSAVNPANGGFSPVSKENWTRRPEPRSGKAPLPPYPLEARRQGIEGKVRLQVSIGRDGRVKNVSILSDPGGGLGPAAVSAMKSLLWLPALGPKGNPVDSVVIYTYTFVLR